MQAFRYLMKMKILMGFTYRFEVVMIILTCLVVMVASVYLWNSAYANVSELCQRLIVINEGRVVEDGKLSAIVRCMSPYRVITLELKKPVTAICSDKVSLEKAEGLKIRCHFDHRKYSASEIIADLAQELEIADLSVLDADIEDMVRLIYRKKQREG